MDFFNTLLVLFVVFLSICIAIICLADSDILTFVAVYLGKDPKDYYDGKVVWITGASSGIGEGLAKELAKCGSKLILSARRRPELERVKKQCKELNTKLKDSDIMVLDFDVTDVECHAQAFTKVINHFGKLDCLVSNAGRSQRAEWAKIDLKVDREMFDLNVFSVVNLNRIVVRYFLENGGGQLVIMSSIAGKVGVPFSGSYTGSKFALHGYFESLRNEVRTQNVDITILCPGPVFSEVLENSFTEEAGRKFEKKMQHDDRRLTSERCGYLSVVAMANKIEESWLALFPIIPLTYLGAYQPYLSSKLLRFMGRRFLKLRDSRDTMKKD